MDNDTDDELVTLLLTSKSKIWEDKKRLGLLEKPNFEGLQKVPHNNSVHVENARSQRSKEEYNLYDDVHEREKKLLISSDRLGFGQVKEYKAEPMVRFGEYSPHNPGLLSPGKTLLGLGEYEEKRRKILERKRHEYLQQIAQARQAVKDAVCGRFSEPNQQQESSEFRLKSYMNTRHTAGTQTDLQVTDHTQDTGYSPLALNDGGISPVAAVGQEIYELPTQSQYPQITTVATQTSAKNMRLPKYQGMPAVDTSETTGIIALPQNASYLPLSPRERKIVEFRESYSPSFLQERPFRPGAFDMTTDIRRRREAYQEELRRQIEEKRHIEAEQQQKEQEKEQAISRRAELQQERMRQEYVQEEALRREKHLQRMRQAEEFQHGQKPLNLAHEAEAKQIFEKRFEDLEAGLHQHTSRSVQSVSGSMPVAGLRAKYFLSETPRESVPSSCLTPPISQNVPEEVTDFSMRNSDTNNRIKKDNTANIIKDNLPEQHHRNSNIDYQYHGGTASCVQLNDKYPLNISNKEYPCHNNVSVSRCSAGKETSEPITISYHRPPTEIIEAANCGNSVQNNLHKDDEDGEEINAIKVQKSTTGHCELPTNGDEQILFLKLPDADKCKNKLDDSLPIPILRAASPVIPSVRTGQAPSCNEVMHKLESKWQVPAVERNVVHTNSDSNKILTQLGAVRHQLQLEQMRMEQYLQQQQKNKS